MKAHKNFLILMMLITCLCSVYIHAQSISKQYSIAMNAFHDGTYSKAYELFRNITANTRDEDYLISAVEFYSAECLYNLQQLNGAASAYENFSYKYRLSDFRKTALYRLGTIYLIQKDFSKCREKLITLLNDYPNSEHTGNAYYWVGESFAGQNKYLEAQEFLLEAISSKRNNEYLDYTIFTLASVYERTKNYQKAVNYYDEILAFHRESELASYAQFRIGVCYFNLKEYDSVILELSDPLITKLPSESQSEAEYYLANAFFRLREFDNAAGIYREILDKYKDDNRINEIRFGLAWVNFQKRDYDEAYDIFNILSKIGTDSLSVSAMYWSAECRRYAGKLGEALNIYEDFFKKYPESSLIPQVQFNIGIINYNTKNISEAEKYLTNAIDSFNDEARCKSLTLLGEIFLEKGDYSTAKDYFLKAVKIPKLQTNLKNRTMFGLGVASYFLSDYVETIRNLNDLYLHAGDFESGKVNFYLAEAYFVTGDFASALRHYNRISTGDDLLGRQALYGKAYSYFNLKDYSNAGIYFNEYINRFTNDLNITDAKLRLADSYYGTKNFDKASQIYGEVFLRDRSLLTNDYAYYQYGQALFKAGRSSDAINEFTTLQRKFPNSKYADDSQYIIGWINFQRGNFEEAINSYIILFENYPRSALRPIAYYSIGDSYYNLGNYRRATEYYSRIIDEFSNTQFVFDAINGIQYCYIAEDKPESAISLIDKFVTNNSASPFGDQVLFKKGEIYYSLGNYEMAENGYKEFIRSYPNSSLIPNAYYWIGKSEEILGDTEEAENNFNYVINNYLQSEAGVSAVIELGNIYVDVKKEYSSAVALYERTSAALPLSNRIPEILYAKADAQIKSGDNALAYETYDQIITYYDGSIFASKSKLKLGLMELERKSYDNAEMLFKEVSENNLDDIGAEAGYYYGLCLFEQGKISDAISAFVRIRSIFSIYDEWYTKSLLRLGDCYGGLGDKTKAREMYKAVVQRHQRDDLGKEANNKLKKL